MDYIGSKVKLLDWMFSIMSPKKGDVFLDACSGSGAVSRYAAGLGVQLIANDLMQFPATLANGSIGISPQQLEDSKFHIQELNNLGGREGYFYNHFCNESTPKRYYFTSDNAKRIDAIREYIETTPPKIKDYLLYCGLEALSRASNTTGVQAAYLKQYKQRSLEKYTLRQENTVSGDVVSYSMDISKLLTHPQYRLTYTEDILYIDPPYNHRQYAPNYHLYETFVRYDNPNPSGVTGLRDWKVDSHSKFCTDKHCLNFLKSIVDKTTAKKVFVSYSNDGILSKDLIMASFDNIVCHERPQKRYRSDLSDSRTYNSTDLFEYLFEISKV